MTSINFYLIFLNYLFFQSSKIGLTDCYVKLDKDLNEKLKRYIITTKTEIKSENEIEVEEHNDLGDIIYKDDVSYYFCFIWFILE